MQRTLLTRGAKASCQPHPAVPVAAASVQFSFSRGPRQVLVAVALWSVFVAAQRAEAQLTTASNGDWQISYDPQTASLLDWGVVGPDGLLDHLEEHSLHYRLAEGTREFRISELTLNDISTPVPQRIVVDYGDASAGDPFGIQLLLDIGALPVEAPDHQQLATVVETISVTNFGEDVLNMLLFGFIDLAIDGLAADDFAFPTNVNSIRQTSGGPFGATVDARIVQGQLPSGFAIEDDPLQQPPNNIIDALEDDQPTILAPPFNAGIAIGDVEQGIQFSLSLEPGDTQNIVARLDGAFFNNDGLTQDTPAIVTPEADGSFVFAAVPGAGFWYDPPFAQGYLYQVNTFVSPTTLFTQFGAPTGVNDPDDAFQIVVEGAVVGEVAGGEVFDFVAEIGTGVLEFAVLGIQPPIDANLNNVTPFPSFLAFNNPLNNTFRMVAIPTLPGDYNANGQVDAPDYNVWRDSFGSTEDLAADGNNNGTIDAPDYNVWRDNFGRVAIPAIPEPASMSLIVTLLVCCLAATQRSIR